MKPAARVIVARLSVAHASGPVLSFPQCCRPAGDLIPSSTRAGRPTPHRSLAHPLEFIAACVVQADGLCAAASLHGISRLYCGLLRTLRSGLRHLFGSMGGGFAGLLGVLRSYLCALFR